MDPRFEELAQHIADDVEKRFFRRFEDSEKHLDGIIVTRLDDAERRLADGARVHMEDLKSAIKAMGDGWIATLEGIERRLTELNAKVDTKFADHDKVLLDHATRIASLERSK